MADDHDGNEQPLRKLAEAFEELANTVNSGSPLELNSLCHACSLVSPLLSCLGVLFKFAEMEYAAKVQDLVKASNYFTTLEAMIDYDIKDNTVEKSWSHTRNLLRVKRALDVLKVFYEQILVMEGDSLKDAASEAYSQVFAPYHVWAIRKAVATGILTLRSKSQMLREVNEDAEDSCTIYLQSYVTSADVVVGYIEKLYTSRDLGIDWI